MGLFVSYLVIFNHPATTIIDGNLADHIIRIESDSVEIIGFTVQNGQGEYDYYDGATGGVIEVYGTGEEIVLENILFLEPGETNIGSLVFTDSPNIIIDHCTFADNSVSALFTWDGKFSVSNSIFLVPSANFTQGLGVEDTISFSLLYPLDDGVYLQPTLTNTCIFDSNPLFCNPDSGDYTLAANSPAVGAGNWVGNTNRLTHRESRPLDHNSRGLFLSPISHRETVVFLL